MTRSLAVTHVIASLDPKTGGPPNIARDLAAEQARRGHHVVILTEQLPPELVAPPGVEYRLLRSRGAELRSSIAASDVVHLHNVWERVLMRAAATAHASGVPYVLIPNGMLDYWSLAQKKWKKRVALALGYKTMLNRAAALHLGNQHEVEAVKALGVRSALRVIPNGMDLSAIDPLPPATEFRAAWPSLADRPYLLFLGRLHFKKGLDILAEAFALLAARRSDVMLVVAGPDDGAGADFDRRIAAANLTARVERPGPLYGRSKWAALAGAACFCLPSRQEGFSVAILEALACSRPVVISNECHFPEVAEARAGEVVPLDAKATANALERVLADETAASVMGRAGRELVETRFTQQRVGELCEELYNFAITMNQVVRLPTHSERYPC